MAHYLYLHSLKLYLQMEKRIGTKTFRYTESYADAIDWLKNEFPRDSEADIIFKGLASLIRSRTYHYKEDKDLQKLRDRLEYGYDTDTPKKPGYQPKKVRGVNPNAKGMWE